MSTPCDRLSDKIPDVAHGRVAWTPDEADHLRACDECGREWRVVSVAADLGRAIASRTDPDRTLARVTARLVADGRARRARRALLGVAAVAAAILLLVRGSPAPEASTSADLPTIALPVLDSLSLDELTELADELEPTAEALPLLDGDPGLDLDLTQLERVLRSLEA